MFHDVSNSKLTISTLLTCGLLQFVYCLFSAKKCSSTFTKLNSCLSSRRQVYISSHGLSSTVLTLLWRCFRATLGKSHTESQHVLAAGLVRWPCFHSSCSHLTSYCTWSILVHLVPYYVCIYCIIWEDMYSYILYNTIYTYIILYTCLYAWRVWLVSWPWFHLCPYGRGHVSAFCRHRGLHRVRRNTIKQRTGRPVDMYCTCLRER